MSDKVAFELDLAAAAQAIKNEVGFTGGHINRFEKIGRHSFDTALALGLESGHKLLDFGAGALRLGYWFVRFLDPGNYYAMEPAGERMEGGKRLLFGPDVLREKAPTFYVSDKCDITAFVKFPLEIASLSLAYGEYLLA